MGRILGPILNVRDATTALWHLSALIVTDGSPGKLSWEVAGQSDEVEAQLLWAEGSYSAYCFELHLPRSAVEGTYWLQDDTIRHKVVIPGPAEEPRSIYISCNGFSDPKVMAKHKAQQMALWSNIGVRHGQQPYHLLIAGGDQVYADSLLHDGKEFEAWAALSFDEANRASLTPTMAKALGGFYFDLYCKRWSDPAMASIMASVPMLAMWDDHDIIDGWGSYPPERQGCAVMKAIFEAARRSFAVFQQHLPAKSKGHPEGFGGTFSRALTIGTTAILALDLRSERTERQVMSPDHAQAVFNWMRSLQQGKIRHLWVMSSIPVVYPSFSLLEELMTFYPGQQELEDDLRDHWNNVAHAQERVRLVHQLIAVSQNGIRPTILSGDVHVAALGQVESTRDPAKVIVINQLIASAVVHPPPPAMVVFGLGLLFQKSMEIDTRIEAKMTPFPGTRNRLIARRNYLVLEPDEQGRVWANWIAEGEQSVYTKVIHPL